MFFLHHVVTVTLAVIDKQINYLKEGISILQTEMKQREHIHSVQISFGSWGLLYIMNSGLKKHVDVINQDGHVVTVDT